MKKIIIYAAAGFMAAAAGQKANAQMDEAAMMKAWEAYSTPGAAHQELAKDVGTWTTSSTMWMQPNDLKPTKSTGTAEITMDYGGRYQIGKHKSSFMGMPFEGTSTVAYNNASKKYESTWIDNMGTGVMFLTGTYNDATKTVTYSGKCVDPMSGKEKTYRETWTIVDNNTRKMEMFDTDKNGKEYKSMEMIMTRK